MTIWYDDLPVADLEFPVYQRETNQQHVQRLVKEWNPHKVGLIQVSKRDGTLYAWDGKHRVLAMRERLPEGVLHCQITDDLSEAQEARLFAEQDNLDKRVAVGAKIWASHLAGDDRMSELLDALKAYGFTIRGVPLEGGKLEIGYFARKWTGPVGAYRLALGTLRHTFGDKVPPWATQGFVFSGLMQAFYPSNQVAVDDDGMAAALKRCGKTVHTLIGSPEQKVRLFRNALGERYNDASITRPKLSYEV
jgi:hypothetical protein